MNRFAAQKSSKSGWNSRVCGRIWLIIWLIGNLGINKLPETRLKQNIFQKCQTKYNIHVQTHKSVKKPCLAEVSQ
jgi:hypothetical protein